MCNSVAFIRPDTNSNLSAFNASNLQIGTSEPWNYALLRENFAKPGALQLDRRVVGDWSEERPFTTTGAPFSISGAGERLILYMLCILCAYRCIFGKR